ncbi:MAG: hypothetical protein RMY28_009635 [Nostoc sp. ChiSLP01]
MSFPIFIYVVINIYLFILVYRNQYDFTDILAVTGTITLPRSLSKH